MAIRLQAIDANLVRVNRLEHYTTRFHLLRSHQVQAAGFQLSPLDCKSTMVSITPRAHESRMYGKQGNVDHLLYGCHSRLEF